jgi:hypothetical protein
MNKKILFIATLEFFFSCNSPTKKTQGKSISNDSVSFHAEILKQDTISNILKSIPPCIKPIFGYRFKVRGDFNGDGIFETFTEHFYSERDHRETNKYYTGIDDAWVFYDSAYKRECISFCLCSNPNLDTIPIGGVLGPIWFKNEGDLDGDGGDEISCVPSRAQQSSINHCYILSFKHRKWKEIYRFEIREWQIPPLPQAGKTYGLWGASGTYAASYDDSLNKEIEKQFNSFPGFIKKLKNGKIKIQTFTHIALDTTLILDLRRHPKPYN